MVFAPWENILKIPLRKKFRGTPMKTDDGYIISYVSRLNGLHIYYKEYGMSSCYTVFSWNEFLVASPVNIFSGLPMESIPAMVAECLA